MKQHKNIKSYIGATSSELFDPTTDAEEILGQLEYIRIFAELFRRFSYPNYEAVFAENLGKYSIITSMPGVLLTVAPHNYSFGYLLKKKILKACYLEVKKPHLVWKTRFIEWAEASYKETVFLPWDWEGNFSQMAALKSWLVINHPEVISLDQFDRNLQQAFWRAMEARYTTLSREYAKIERQPQKNERPPAGSLHYKVHQALRQAITDLSQPQSISSQEWYINICGRLSATNIVHKLKTQ